MVRGVARGIASLLGTVVVALGSTEAVAQSGLDIALPPIPDSAGTAGGAGGGGGGAAPASSGRWTIRPFFEIREALTDNVFLTTSGREADFITTFSPGLSVRGQGARVRLNFDYSLNADVYARNSSLNGFRNNFAGTGNVELIQRSIFVDVAGFAGQDNSVTRGGQSSAIDRRLANNGNQIFSYSISPYWTARYGPWASSTLRYRFAQFFTSNNSASDTPTTAASLGNSTFQDITASIVSGENFSAFTWDIQTSYRDSDSGANGNLQSWSGTFNGSYHVNRTYALLGSIGYERINSGSFSNSINEPTWNIGLAYTPHERLSASVRYGHRYGGSTWSGDLRYQIFPQTSLTASYTESVTTQQQLALEGLGFIATNPTTGQLIDTRTGLPFVGRDPRFDQTNQVFIQRQFQTSLQAIRGRNTYIINFFYTTRDGNVADVTGSNSQDRNTAGSFVYTRSVSRVTDATAALYYSRGSNNSGGSDRTFRADASLRYQMNESLIATAGYSFIDRDSQGQQFFPNQFTGSYRENVVFVSLRKSF